MSTYSYPGIQVSTAGLATSTKQDTIIAELQDIDANTLGVSTEATLSTLNGKVTAVDTGSVTIASSALPTGAATEATAATLATQATLAAQAANIALLEARLAGSLVPEAHNYLINTYVAAGNGIGEIETVIYKTGGAGGSTVATLTLTYDANDKLSTVTRS